MDNGFPFMDFNAPQSICTCLEGVGKTSMINLLCKSIYNSKPSFTVGCNTEVKVCTMRVFPAIDLFDYFCIFQIYGGEKKSKIFLEFWDIGGRDEYALSRRCLYKDIDGS